MKGYSFQELVNLAEAAVKRAGDTMTGNLTALKVLVSGAQGTEANALTRYDYFTRQLPERATRIPSGADLNTYQTAGFYYQDSNVDATSGSNYPTGLAGSLTVLKTAGVTQEYRVYGQSLTFKRGYYGGAWSAWQKVYDAANKPTAADVNAVSKAGDTMTGGLTINHSNSHINFGLVDGMRKWHLETITNKGFMVVESEVAEHTEFIPGGNLKVRGDLFSGSSKVYHQGFKPTAAEVGAVAKTGDTMTGNLSMSGNTEIRFTAFNHGTSIANGTGDGATQDKTNLQIKSWQGIGISPTAGLPAGMTMGQNSIWINARNGNISTIGDIFANQSLVSAAQGTQANALTRKDYVDGEIAKQVSRTGDTMTGNLTVPAVNLSGSQSSAPNTVTRKDYVDAELAKKLNLTGGTLTGNLTAPAVLVSSAQNTSVNALTRKDYVDYAIAAGDALKVSKAGDTMTGALHLSSSTFGTAGVSAGTTFNGMYGNARVPHIVESNTSGNTYAPALAARYTHNAGWAGIYSLGVLNYNAQSPGSFCVHHINSGGDQAFLWQFNGSSGDFTAPGSIFAESAQNNNGHALTRKDYVDGQVATRAPTTHTHTAAQGNADIVASGYGQIGTYALLKSLSSSNLGPGSILEGTSLQYVSCSGKDNYSAPSPGGTWKCLGIANSFKNSEGSGATLWVRIA